MSLYETWWQSFFGTGNKEFSGYSKTEEMVKCPTCGDLAPKKYIDATGECQICVEDFYQKNYREGK